MGDLAIDFQQPYRDGKGCEVKACRHQIRLIERFSLARRKSIQQKNRVGNLGADCEKPLAVSACLHDPSAKRKLKIPNAATKVLRVA
jgi:hypothetical protein